MISCIGNGKMTYQSKLDDFIFIYIAHTNLYDVILRIATACPHYDQVYTIL